MRRALAPILAAALLGACNESQSNEVAIQLVTATSLNPAGEFGDGSMLVYVEQADLGFEKREYPFHDGTFDEPWEIESLTPLTRIAVRFEFDDDDRILHGAIPWFVPFTAGVVRIPVGAPATCQALTTPDQTTTLADTRLDPAILSFDSYNQWVLGGENAGTGGHDRIGVIVPIYLSLNAGYGEVSRQDGSVLFPELPGELGEAHSVMLSDDSALVVGDSESGGAAFTITRTLDDAIYTRVDLTDMVHLGVGAGSTVALYRNGVAIVGGGDETNRVASVTWMNRSGGMITTTALQAARYRPAVVLLDDGHLLVAGGQAADDFLFEIVPIRGDGVPISAHTGVRERPILVRPPTSVTAARGSAFLVGGTDASGEPIATTLRLTGCPDTASCTITDGPTWNAPRIAPAVVETETGTLLLGGSTSDPERPTSAAWDRVTFVGSELLFEQDHLLDDPRARATAVHVGHGIVILVGGETAPGDPILTFEMCWPPQIEGLTDFP